VYLDYSLDAIALDFQREAPYVKREDMIHVPFITLRSIPLTLLVLDNTDWRLIRPTSRFVM